MYRSYADPRHGKELLTLPRAGTAAPPFDAAVIPAHLQTGVRQTRYSAAKAAYMVVCCAPRIVLIVR